jgi:hypothetical protein
MRKIINQVTLVLVVSVSLFACSKDDTSIVVVNVDKVVNDLRADTIIGKDLITGMPVSAGKYTFYSLERNEIVANSDSATSKWDVAFAGTTILTNSGTSYSNGIGGGFVYKGVLYDTLSKVPADSVFRTDNTSASPKIYAITTGSSKGWYNYDFATSLVTPLAGRVLIIKTASGKYAKMEILNYYKGGITPTTGTDAEKLTKQRYYKFRFKFQSNGTKTF